MEIKTKYSCGDKVWVWGGYDCAEQITVGQVRAEVTQSKGLNGGYVDSGCNVAFDNYKSQSGYKEQYMCVETGIGSGTVWSVDRMFDSKKDCIAANKKRIDELKKQEEKEKKRKDDEKLRNEMYLRAQLDDIEKIKKSRG